MMSNCSDSFQILISLAEAGGILGAHDSAKFFLIRDVGILKGTADKIANAVFESHRATTLSGESRIFVINLSPIGRTFLRAV